MPPARIHAIVHGSRSITAETALRLAAYFETTPETWINLQAEYDLRVARRAKGAEIVRTVRKRAAA
ncbi:MAG: HigA family addiction module antitoxin [Bryobacter sp.]|nr:HigA family addiction module antitoxin [Bryobacter sp.]